MEETVNVAISKRLYEEMEKIVEESEFNSVEEYVTFVLQEVMKEDEEVETLSKEEEEEVKERLRGLGYL